MKNQTTPTSRPTHPIPNSSNQNSQNHPKIIKLSTKRNPKCLISSHFCRLTFKCITFQVTGDIIHLIITITTSIHINGIHKIIKGKDCDWLLQISLINIIKDPTLRSSRSCFCCCCSIGEKGKTKMNNREKFLFVEDRFLWTMISKTMPPNN